MSCVTTLFSVIAVVSSTRQPSFLGSFGMCSWEEGKGKNGVVRVQLRGRTEAARNEGTFMRGAVIRFATPLAES